MTPHAASTVETTEPTPSVERSAPTTRRVTFDRDLAAVPKHFAGDGDLVMSHLFAVLSASFPEGEDYFVRSVRAFRDRVTDPALAAAVRGFIGQETVHRRQHDALNGRLAELGYPTKRIDTFTRVGIRIRERISKPETNLAATAALEHVTASLAELMMEDEAFRAAIGTSLVGEMFLWHALEEAEHKSVAFDVYKLTDGGERRRVLIMRGVRVGIVGGMILETAISLARDRETYRKGALRASIQRFRATPLANGELWRRLRTYDEPDFHPDDVDSTALIEHWQQALFGPDGELRNRLAA